MADWAEQEQGWGEEEQGWGDEGQAQEVVAPHTVQVPAKKLRDPWRKPAKVTVRHINAHIFINAMGKHLKKAASFDLPSWVDIVKTGPSKEMPPADPDWLYYRVGMSKLLPLGVRMLILCR